VVGPDVCRLRLGLAGAKCEVAGPANRLGFAVSLASEVADVKRESEKARKLGRWLDVLERARLAGEDTFCHDSMTKAEREWLRDHRSPVASHWNLLTDMEGKHLPYGS
jgi:hypothetical protein